MKKAIFILCFCWCILGYAQTTYEFTRIEESENTPTEIQREKNINTAKDRYFLTTPNDKYNGKEFDYDDHIKAEEPEKLERKIEPIEPPKVEGSGLSLRLILLIVLATLAIVAILYKSDFSYFALSKYRQKKEDDLVSLDDQNIDENDFARLLAKAIQEKNYRLATRYHYLSLIKRLSDRNYIEYHKDKTNSEYQFELKEDVMRTGFSYLSYIYSYVWYGEFPVDELKFATIEKKYESFMSQIK